MDDPLDFSTRPGMIAITEDVGEGVIWTQAGMLAVIETYIAQGRKTLSGTAARHILDEFAPQGD